MCVTALLFVLHRIAASNSFDAVRFALLWGKYSVVCSGNYYYLASFHTKCFSRPLCLCPSPPINVLQPSHPSRAAKRIFFPKISHPQSHHMTVHHVTNAIRYARAFVIRFVKWKNMIDGCFVWLEINFKYSPMHSRADSHTCTIQVDVSLAHTKFIFACIPLGGYWTPAMLRQRFRI